MSLYAIVGSTLRIAWITLLVVWIIMALRVKRAIKKEAPWSQIAHRTIAVLAYFLLFNDKWPWATLDAPVIPHKQAVELTGAALTCAGVALAIWARAVLGKNWSATVTVKQDHRLIREGPYSLVRHPIYSGLLLAILGTALVVGKVRGLAAFAIAVIVWHFKARLEERFMIEEFGPEYEEYRRRTHALVPFIL